MANQEVYSDIDSVDSYEDENYTSRYVFASVELHSDRFHGGSYENNPDDAEMNGRFLFMMSIPREWRIVRNISLMRRLSLLYRYRNYRGELRHPNIRNYEEIMFSSLCVQPQIVQVVEGPNDYTSCIIKTTYIRQLQRKWKKMYAERQQVLRERMNPMEQVKRQISGKYTSRWK